MRRQDIVRSLAMLLLAVSLGGCAVRDGPLFTPATAPPDDLALVYIYRTDALRGVGAADLELGPDDLGKLHDLEYITLIMRPGRHKLSLRFRWMGLIPRSWNHIEFEAKAGQATYVQAFAQYETIGATMADRDFQEPGTVQRADVGIFVAVRDEAKALPEIRRCYKVVRR